MRTIGHLCTYSILILSLLSCNQDSNQNQEDSLAVNVSQVDANYGQPNPQAPEEIQEYGQFVGKWDILISQPDSNNNWIESNATWVFKYILDGHAIQDFWTNPSEPSPGQASFLGTNVRIYNPQLKHWQCMWLENRTYNMNGIWQSYQNEEDEIILKDSTNTWEITFFNISEQSFDWRWDIIQNDGNRNAISRIKATRLE